jgi:hypothetical protein
VEFSSSNNTLIFDIEIFDNTISSTNREYTTGCTDFSQSSYLFIVLKQLNGFLLFDSQKL